MKRELFLNGKIYTGELPFQEAFVVEDGRFLYVGSREGALSLETEESRRIDLGGNFVCPGFNDSHMHLLNYGYTLTMVDLKGHTSSLKEIKDTLSAALRERKENGKTEGWLKGRGWNQDSFSDEKRFPTRFDLDEVSKETPICITRACGHCCVVNSKALELMGCSRKAPGFAKGSVDTDEEGTPNGIFREDAMNLVYENMPKPTKAELKEMLLAAMKKLNACGITSCQTDDFTAFEIPYEEVLTAYQELKEEKRLTVRIYEQAQLKDLEELQKFLGEGRNTGVGDELLKIGPLKIVADGSLGSRTAYLSRAYADAPGVRGIALVSPKELNERIGYANAHGMQAAVHTIGDGILDWVLSAYEKTLKEFPGRDHRHGLIHCQITRPEQIRKISRLGLTVYAQPIFLDSDIRIVKDRVGEELAESSYAFHTLKDLGVHVSSGTDCPVESPAVLPCIQCAVTRCSLNGEYGPYLPKEGMTVEEALRSYTEEGAYASFEEKEKGRIQEGMLADFVLLSKDPFEVSPEKLGGISVLSTYLSGRQVFGKPY